MYFEHISPAAHATQDSSQVYLIFTAVKSSSFSTETSARPSDGISAAIHTPNELETNVPMAKIYCTLGNFSLRQ